VATRQRVLPFEFGEFHPKRRRADKQQQRARKPGRRERPAQFAAELAHAERGDQRHKQDVRRLELPIRSQSAKDFLALALLLANFSQTATTLTPS
jgi:hypothetical protein